MFSPLVEAYRKADLQAVERAHALLRREQRRKCSSLTQTWTELLYRNTADFTAYASSATEGSLIGGGNNTQPTFPALFFDQKPGRAVLIEADGIISNTSTPTIIWQLRFGTTIGTTQYGGTSVGVTAAITTASGITNKYWYLRALITCNTPGQGSGNTTLNCAGYVMSPGAFASPFTYAIEPTTPDTATWTATIDDSLTQYMNLTGTWSASSGSNTITAKHLWVYGLN